MRLSHQIAFAMTSVVSGVLMLVALLLYLSVARGFASYVHSLEEASLAGALGRLADHYERQGSWQALMGDPRSFRRLIKRERDSGQDNRDQNDSYRDDLGRQKLCRRGGSDLACDSSALPFGATRAEVGVDSERHRKRPDPLQLPPRVTLYGVDGVRLVGQGSPQTDVSRLPIVSGGAVVGYLGVRAIEHLEDQLEVDYLARVRRDLWTVALVAALLAVFVAVLLARRIVRPILQLRDATRRLTQGENVAALGIARDDELGQLAHDVETLSAALAATARARQQWVADTSHELRTPLTILRGEIESLLDGMRPIDSTAILSLDCELTRLSNLVDDLAQLATSDRAEPQIARVPVCLGPLIERVAEAFGVPMQRAGLALICDVQALAELRVLGDSERLAQVLTNLLENSLRYTHSGGNVLIHGKAENGTAIVCVDDSAPGVAPALHERLFERFFRVDSSRSRDLGGAGLGLAICRQWVEALGGTVAASDSPLGGLRVTVRLPCMMVETQ